MADLRISELIHANTPLSGVEEVPLVQGGVTKKASVNDFLSGFLAALNLKQDVLLEGPFVDGDKSKLDGIEPGAKDDQLAVEVPYDNTLSGLTAIEVQGAIDEIAQGTSNHSQLTLDDGTNPHGTTKSDVGLSNVDNTSDLLKPISTDTQTALNLKEDAVNKKIAMTGNETSDVFFLTAKATYDWAVSLFQPLLISGTNIKTLEGQSILGSGNIDLTKADVGLSNVDDTSDLLKPISTATQTALNLKEDLSNKAITMTGNTSSNTLYLTSKATYDWAVSLFQPLLISGTNIKTIDGQSILGSGNLSSPVNLNNWSKTGDAGTSSSTNFLGTTDNIDLVFRTGNRRSGFLSGPTNSLTVFGYDCFPNANANTTNTGFGKQVGISVVTASHNALFGWNAGNGLSSGGFNAVLGSLALSVNTTGANNTAIGYRAGDQLNGGGNNVFVGKDAGLNTISNGSNNIIIGANTNMVGGGALSNQINIGNYWYKLSTGECGINTSVPTKTWDINGELRVRTIPTGLNTENILVVNGSGDVRSIATSSLNNLYNVNGTISSNRTVSLGANTLAFTSGIVNGFSVDGSTFSVDALNNRAGVGTATPNAKLQVNEGNVYVTNGGNAPGAGGEISFGVSIFPNVNPMSSIGGYLQSGNTSEIQGGIIFKTRPAGAVGQVLTDRMFISENGNVGIGAIIPTAKLEVAGFGGIYNIADNMGGWSASNYSGLRGSGKLGIGWNITGGQAEVDLISSNIASGLYPGGFNFYDLGSSANSLPNLLLRIEGNTGNVAIGTNAPKSRLHVVGLINFADNAAALAGGLTAGAFYHTSGTLKVVI